MEEKLKSKAKKETLLKSKVIIVLFPIILGMVYVGIVFTTETFPLKTMIYVLILMITALLLYIILRLSFINKSSFIYGKVIKIDRNDPSNSLVYQNFFIEYIDKNNNKTYQTIVYDQYGDNDEEVLEEIQDFYQEGQKLLNENVPLLYIPNKPKRTLVFLEEAGYYQSEEVKGVGYGRRKYK